MNAILTSGLDRVVMDAATRTEENISWAVKIIKVGTAIGAVLGMGPAVLLIALAIAFNDHLALLVLPWWGWVLWISCVAAQSYFAWQRRDIGN